MPAFTTPSKEVISTLLDHTSDSSTVNTQCIESIDDSYSSRDDWHHDTIHIDTSSRSYEPLDISARSAPVFSSSRPFNKSRSGEIDLSTQTAPDRRVRDIESGERKKYLTYVETPSRRPRISLPDLTLPTLRESLELKQIDDLLHVEPNSSDAKVDRKSLSRRSFRSASFRRSFRKGGSSNGSSKYSKSLRDEDIDQGSLLPNTKWWHGFFLFSIISLIACIVTLWAPYPIGARMPTEMVAETPWSDGCKDNLDACICPRETICADDLLSMILLTISRCSAWFDYPLYMCLFLSKCNNLNNYLQKTVLRCWINFSDYHKVHRLFGIIVGVESASHSFFHLYRWKCRSDDIKLLWTTCTGVTGMIALVSGAFVILPMSVPYLKNLMTYEWRKGLHYLSIVWAAGLMFHAPQRIFWMIGVPLFLYLTDKALEIFSKTFLIESAHFQRLSDTCLTITFENPPGFGNHNSAYVYLMLPWLSKYQFHAFTIFPGNLPNTSSICISKCGDWTKSLIEEITTPSHKPAFIAGPFLSPFSSPAMDSENVIAVASGIGVTPAVSLIKKYSSTSRRMSLIWICRDAALVEHFLPSLELSTGGWILVYYTGKRPLFLNEDLPSNVFLCNGRPNLERTISGVIYSIANDSCLPDEVFSKNSIVTKATPEITAKLILVKALSIYSIDQLFDYAVRVSTSFEEDLPEWSAASFDGVLKMINDLICVDCEHELLKTKAIKILDLVDNYGSSIVDKDTFEDFMQLMMSADVESTQSVASSQDCKTTSLDVSRVSLADINDTITNGMFGIKRVLKSGKYSGKKWNMLYCGGSEAVLAQLREYKHKYSIGLSVEKFDW